MESKIKENTYYSVQSFMVKNLGLKDVELALYAIIYGFSQDGESTFNGSLAYLAEWTGKSKECICRNLKSLVDKGYLSKSESVVNGIKVCSYKCINPIDLKSIPLTKNQYPIDKKSMPPLTENQCPIDLKSTNNIEDNKDSYIIEEIITYLNEKTKANYRANNKQTVQVIRAKMKEGYTLSDFKTVIDNKCAEWLKDSKMRNYLRPQTLFGTKFEGYLNSGRITHDTPNLDMGEYEQRAERLPVYVKGAG